MLSRTREDVPREGRDMFQSPDERGIECYWDILNRTKGILLYVEFQSPDERGIECYRALDEMLAIFHKLSFNPLMSGA